MAFQQLYYTSCKHGISGSAGYQFNAVTPGVSPEVMRQVENLTSYEPPRSLPHAPTDGEIAACPVSLCYAPGDTAIVANVVFTGADYSRRMGNYFAHAITTVQPGQDLDGVLPIELWQAPLWKSTTVDAAQLPELSPPLPAGAFDRDTVEAFVDAHVQGGRLPALVTAAWRAVTSGERSIVLVEPETQAAAAWIAAISYLMPPAAGRAMSFTTYHRRPSYCPLHVIGTIPDADIDQGDAALESFALFDFAGGRFSGVDVHPLAALLTRIGVVAAETLWQYGSPLETGAESSIDDWYPVASTAAARAGVHLRESELDAAVNWIPEVAEQLGADVVSSVCTALLDQTEFDDRHLRPLVNAAGTGDASEILDELERRLVDVEFAQVLQGGIADGDYPEPIISPAVKAYARQRCDAALSGPSVDVRTALRVLGWASATKAPVGDRALRATGHHIIGPGLLGAPPGDEIRGFASAWPALRVGIIDCLAETEPVVVLDAFNSGLGGLLEAQDVGGHPVLHELLLISAAQRDPTIRNDTLRDILRLRANAGLGMSEADRELLERLWPQRRWAVLDARLLLASLEIAQVLAGDIPLWMSRTVLAPDLEDEQAERAYVELCSNLERHPVYTSLDKDAQEYITRVRFVDELLTKLDRPSDYKVETARRLAKTYYDAPRPAQILIVRHLSLALAALEPEHLGKVLVIVADPVWKRFLEHVRPHLEPARPHIVLAANLFTVMEKLQHTELSYGAELETALLDTLLSWKRRDQDKLELELLRIRVGLKPAFVEWRDLHHKSRRHGFLGKTFRRKPRNETRDD